MKSLPILGIVAKLKEKQKLCFVKESLGGKKKYCDLRQAGLNFCNAAHKAKKSREREIPLHTKQQSDDNDGGGGWVGGLILILMNI